MKEKVIEVLTNKNFIFLIVVLIGIGFINSLWHKGTKVDLVIEEPIEKLDLGKDKNFLKCNRKQLECYYKNLGLKRETILSACKDILYCDEVK